jgi:hypothetical protein
MKESSPTKLIRKQTANSKVNNFILEDRSQNDVTGDVATSIYVRFYISFSNDSYLTQNLKGIAIPQDKKRHAL